MVILEEIADNWCELAFFPPSTMKFCCIFILNVRAVFSLYLHLCPSLPLLLSLSAPPQTLFLLYPSVHVVHPLIRVLSSYLRC